MNEFKFICNALEANVTTHRNIYVKVTLLELKVEAYVQHV